MAKKKVKKKTKIKPEKPQESAEPLDLASVVKNSDNGVYS